MPFTLVERNGGERPGSDEPCRRQKRRNPKKRRDCATHQPVARAESVCEKGKRQRGDEDREQRGADVAPGEDEEVRDGENQRWKQEYAEGAAYADRLSLPRRLCNGCATDDGRGHDNCQSPFRGDESCGEIRAKRKGENPGETKSATRASGDTDKREEQREKRELSADCGGVWRRVLEEDCQRGNGDDEVVRAAPAHGLEERRKDGDEKREQHRTCQSLRRVRDA